LANSLVPIPGITDGLPSITAGSLRVPPDLRRRRVAAVADGLATDAPQLVAPHVRGLRYPDAPSMIPNGLVPLHPGAVRAYQKLQG